MKRLSRFWLIRDRLTRRGARLLARVAGPRTTITVTSHAPTGWSKLCPECGVPLSNRRFRDRWHRNHAHRRNAQLKVS